jgi:CubicO group peptidase (beta-lactamase class C family)
MFARMRCPLVAVCVMQAALATAQVSPPEARSDIVPGAEWQVAKPESVGFSSSRLEGLRGWVKTDDTSSMMVVVRGRAIFTYGDVSHSSRVFSVRKSVLGMLYGNYVASGKIDLAKTVKEIGITDKQPLLPIEETATLQQLLASRSGVYHPTGSTGQADYMPKRGTQDPGHYYVYNNWDFDAAGVAFEKLTGKGIYEALQTDLASPLEMQDYHANQQEKEYLPPSSLGAYSMRLSTRDMARLGLLMLDKGRWNGKQVIPSDWVRFLTTEVTPRIDIHPDYFPDDGIRERWGYGYLWWVWDSPAGPGEVYSLAFDGAYSAMGTGGNYITVIPAYNMVVVHQVDRDKNPNAQVFESSYMAMLSMLFNSYCGHDCK